MLREEKKVDRIEVTEIGVIQVRESNTIYRGDEVVAKTFHRWVLNPGQDISDQPDNVKAIAEAAWTPEILSAYATLLESKNLGQ